MSSPERQSETETTTRTSFIALDRVKSWPAVRRILRNCFMKLGIASRRGAKSAKSEQEWSESEPFSLLRDFVRLCGSPLRFAPGLLCVSFSNSF